MRYLFLLLLIITHQFSGAQHALKVKSFSVDQGLPQSTVWDILQDDYGFLWVSTADGLCRFDGYSFNTYRNNVLDSLSIGGNTMHMMSKDPSGNIWFTHENGLDIYESEHGYFHHPLRFEKTNINGLNKTLGVDAHGNMWLWIRGQGLKQYNLSARKIISTFKPGNIILERPAQDGFVDRVSGEIVFSQSNPYITIFNPVNSLFTSIQIHEGWNVNSVIQLNDSVYLLGTSKGLVRLNKHSGHQEKIPFSIISSAKKYELFVATSLLHHRDDEYWVGTSNGIFIYHDKTKSFSAFYNSVTGSKENFLFVQKLFKDKSGNIWIGTNGDGLKKYSSHVPPWKHYRSSSDRSDIVKSVFNNGGDTVLVGYYQNGLDVFSKTKGWLKKIRKGKILPSDNVYGINEITKDEIFVGFSDSPPNLFGILNLKKNSFTNLNQKITDALQMPPQGGNPFISTFKTKSGNIIFTYQSHLLELHQSQEKAYNVRKIHTFENEIINSVFIDSKGRYCVGTMNGYYSKSPEGNWQKGNAEINKQVKTINEDNTGNIWLGTVSGLYLLNKKHEVIAVYRMDKELINDFIYGILKDNQGNMWFSHNKGLTKYDPQRKSFRNFSVDDGLQANEFNTGAFWKSESGELFFGGINGTNSFYPEEISENFEKPVVQITRLEVNDKMFASNNVSWAQREIQLDHENNTLAFEIAGLEFTEPGKNQYAWRMIGVDRDWVQAGNRRFTRYANMPPGEYTFEVKASNNDGIWNENATRLKIIITPPFWQTWWFISLVALIAVITIATIAFLISRQRYKRKITELLMQQKIQHDRERISRDLHDNVGAMVSFVGTKVDWLLRHNTFNKETTSNLQVIKESANSTMIGLRETIWTLQDKIITNTDLADKLKVYAKSHLIMDCNIIDEISSESPLGNDVVLNIYRACQEIINNINKHSAATLVEINFTNLQHSFEVELCDNGKGFDPESYNNKEHYGLENIKTRLGEVGANVFIKSEINNGTKIKIVI